MKIADRDRDLPLVDQVLEHLAREAALGVGGALAVLEHQHVGGLIRLVLRGHVHPVAPHRAREDPALEGDRPLEPSLGTPGCGSESGPRVYNCAGCVGTGGPGRERRDGRTADQGARRVARASAWAAVCSTRPQSVRGPERLTWRARRSGRRGCRRGSSRPTRCRTAPAPDPGLDRGRLDLRLGGRALDRRRGVLDPRSTVIGQVERDHALLEQHGLHLEVLEQVAGRVAHARRRRASSARSSRGP